MRLLAALLILVMVIPGSGAMAQEPAAVPALKSAPPAVPLVIEPADAEDFREIIETTIPPRYNRALIRWFQVIFQRQQAAAKTAAERPKDSTK